ncbi:hypothetical protein FSP39_017349, partial [Pinctada imbricata]
YCDSSPGVGEDSAFGTLASTDSYACEQKLRSDSLQSGHLDVFGLEETGLQIPVYPDISNSDPISESRAINFEERLTKTHSIWFLPDIGRSGAVHLLKDREPGTFIIRNSSQPSTMALSAQFPEKGRANVDHYLIQHTDQGYRVQGSLHYFNSIPNLIVYYHENTEELPYRLLLPPTIRRAKTLQELTSLSYLGQDFWTSYRFDRGVLGYSNFENRNLHKSTSEPVNITQASHFHGTTPQIARIMPSKSMQQFASESPFSSSAASTLEKSSPSFHSLNESASSSERNLVTFSASPGKENNIDQNVTSDSTCCKCKSKISSTQTRSQDSLPSSANSSERSRSVERTMPNTHPRTPSKHNSNLYFTTSIELLNNSENQYFHSNLSDKMSDYEDIWKHSASATPVPSVKLPPMRTFSTQASENDAFENPPEKKPVEPIYSKPDKSAMNNKGSKKDLNTRVQKSVETTHNDLSGNDVSQNEPNSLQGNTVSKEEELSENVKCNLRRTLSLDDYKIKNAKRSDSVETKLTEAKSTASVHTQTSPKMRNKPGPIPPVDNDASSTSTALSSVKSPVYAEPFDSLVPPKEKSKKSKIRRRSAPSMGFSARKAKGVSQTPALETIFSPNFDHSLSLHESFNFKQIDNHSCAMMDSLPPSGLRRTQSAKSRLRHSETAPVLNRDSLNEVVQKLEKLSVQRDNSTNDAGAVSAQSKPKTDKTKCGVKRKKQPNSSANVQNTHNDLSWEALSKEEEEVAASTLRKFPVYKRHVSDSSSADESSTVEEIISSVNPALTLKPLKLVNPLLRVNQSAMSEYDNLTNQYAPASHRSHASTGTVFCKPWENSHFFEALMDPKNCKLPPPMDVNERIHAWQAASQTFNKEGNPNRDSLFSETSVDDENLDGEETCTSIHTPAVYVRPPSEDDAEEVKGHKSRRLIQQGHRVLSYASEDENVPSFPLNLPGLKNTIPPAHPVHTQFLQNKLKSSHPDSKIEEYICRLSRDHSTTFGSTIENFIQCTLESQETNPHHVTRNVRQFMTGIRNYLVKHGEGELEDIIERERTRLKADEILNIDAIIERALHTCVLRPLKHHIYNLFVDEYTRNGSLPTLSMNLKYARTKSAEEIGLRVSNGSQKKSGQVSMGADGAMIAHKFKITNPQDYGLYILVKGEETRMGDMDCPQLFKIDHLTQGRECVFAYKRNEANIAWPMSLKKQ